jgi:hypothetical protein
MTKNLTDALSLITAVAALPELTLPQLFLVTVVLYVHSHDSPER